MPWRMGCYGILLKRAVRVSECANLDAEQQTRIWILEIVSIMGIQPFEGYGRLKSKTRLTDVRIHRADKCSTWHKTLLYKWLFLLLNYLVNGDVFEHIKLTGFPRLCPEKDLQPRIVTF